MNIRVLNPDDYHLVAWKHRNGMSTELYIEPHDAYLGDFDWRIARATIDAQGKFSVFEGVDRSIAVISGKLVLHLDSGDVVTMTKDTPPLGFKGESMNWNDMPTDELITFHAMSRRTKCTHILSSDRVIAGVDKMLRVKCDTIAIYHAGGLAMTIECDGQPTSISFGQTLIITGLNTKNFHKLQFHGESAKFFMTQITPVTS